MTVAATKLASSIAAASSDGLLINIDNGGTLTDICVIDGDRVHRTKTITTPYDLSKCLFEGIKKASRLIYGEDDPQRLLLATELIRYSTTQGTNALVERKGPRLGLVTDGNLSLQSLRGDAQSAGLFDALVGSRVEQLDITQSAEALDAAATRAITVLSSAGANRIVVAFGGAGRNEAENALKRVLLRRFPPHLLGALPILYSHELSGDADDSRRAWTALFNAFLHPAMERFLYAAEHRLREYKTRNPLLIFRNDGNAARVARTVAIKTYSSGPRGGAEGAKALAAHYGFKSLLTMDIGGTTTDIALVENGAVRTEERGRVEGVATSFPLCDVISVGVGGSSIINVQDGRTIKVGPESVGGAPGPACFGLGGKEATITDAFLLAGLLDPASYFGGELKIDAERAQAAITTAVAGPLKLDVQAAVQQMEAAWVAKVANSLKQFTTISDQTTLAAFGGAGPFVVCKAAEAAGISRVIIPGLAAVFSAFGIGFSDVGHSFEMTLPAATDAGLAAARAALLQQAERGMFAEGAKLSDCRVQATLHAASGDQHHSIDVDGDVLPKGLPAKAELTLRLLAVKPVAHPHLKGAFGLKGAAAVSTATRTALVDGKSAVLPLYRVEEQKAGAHARGPCVLEEAFFTSRIDAGWSFEINQAGDILLSRA